MSESSQRHERKPYGWLVGTVAIICALLPRLPLPTTTPSTAQPTQAATQTTSTLHVLDAGRAVRTARVEADGSVWRADRAGRIELPADTDFVLTAPGFVIIRGRSPGPSEELPLTLQRAAPISGWVRDHEGLPIEGARVSAAPILMASIVQSEAVSTDADGAFMLSSPPSGPVRLSVLADGYGVDSRVVGELEGGQDAARDEVVFVLSPAATIAGVVYDERGSPAAGANVRLVGSGIWPAAIALTDDVGRYRFGEVPAGIYEISAHLDRQVSPATRGITVETGESVYAPLRMVPGQRLQGTVRGASGPIEGAEVRVIGGGITLDPIVVSTDAAGTFDLRALLPTLGTRVLMVQAEGYVSRQLDVAAEMLDLDVLLERTAVVRGIVVDERGRPIAGASVQWMAEGGRPTRSPTSTNLGVTSGPVPPIPIGQGGPTLAVGFGDATSNADGSFELVGLDPGVGRLSANHADHAPAESEELTLGPAGSRDGIRLVMLDGARLEGRVVDSRGFGVAAIPVDLLSDRERLPRSTLSSEDGSFTFGGCLGTLTLTARPFGAPAARVVLLVQTGERREVQIELPTELLELRGRIVDSRGFPIADAGLRLLGTRAEAPLERVGGSARDGTFDFSSLPAPPYMLEVDHPDYAPRSIDIAGVDAEARIALERGGVITGEVIDDWREVPLVGALVTLNMEGLPPEVTNDAGRFRFERVPYGTYTLEAQARGRMPIERDISLARSLLRLDALRVGVTGALEVEVVGSLGYPAQGSRVFVDGVQAGVTDARGMARVEGVEPGEHRVSAQHLDAGEAEVGPLRVDPEGVTPTRITLPTRVPVGATEIVTDTSTEREGIAVVVSRSGGDIILTHVVERSLASRGGLRTGDRLIRIDGEDVLSAGQARSAFRGDAGTRVRVEVRRGTRTIRRTIERERYASP